MRIQDIMSTKVQTVRPDERCAAAAERLKLKGIHHLVVMSDGWIAGVISERDLRRGGDCPVADLMTGRVVSARPEMTVRQAANLMRGRSIGCLPVTDGERLVGIVTISDLLEQIGRGSMRPIQESVRWTLRGRGQRGARPAARTN